VKDKNIKNIASSVRQRLFNISRQNREDFQNVLTRYAIERFLYRLSLSPYRDIFVVKGAILFYFWGIDRSRQTRDLDLLVFGRNDIPFMESVFRDVCKFPVEDDGIIFNPDSVRGESIKKSDRYEGVRINIESFITSARILLQIEIGFGDVITPEPTEWKMPAVLDFPSPSLRIYPRETLVSEKFEAMTRLGMINSRMKDFYDIWILSRHFPFDGKILCMAIKRTFICRNTPLPYAPPTAFTPEFFEDEIKCRQWKAFFLSKGIKQEDDLSSVIMAISEFIMPPVRFLSEEGHFKLNWEPGKGWV